MQSTRAPSLQITVMENVKFRPTNVSDETNGLFAYFNTVSEGENQSNMGTFKYGLQFHGKSEPLGMGSPSAKTPGFPAQWFGYLVPCLNF